MPPNSLYYLVDDNRSRFMLVLHEVKHKTFFVELFALFISGFRDTI